MDQRFTDGFWHSADGLKLHYRDYEGGAEGRPPILCMHGLTRNVRDFAGVAERLSPAWRVIVPEMRGRGESGYADDSSTYNPVQYVEDVERLLDALKVDRFVAIGTSLGGLMTILLSSKNPERIAGAVLNDIGPQIEEAGLDKIRTYVGQGRSFPTWMHAARALEETHSDAHPTYELEDWLQAAKRTMVLGQNGRISFDYDMAVGDAFREADDGGGAPAANLWVAFESLGDTPLLLVRGALSNLLSEETVRQMKARNRDMEVVVVPDTGHAPTLEEPEAIAAIDTLLAKVRAQETV
ncbi:alpha/beta fold hydrolase [Alteriqipengyuania lutimaris]|uniref:Alpha/beta hydrolase n=1 Tax=Alteriqipengyuania lutimaris TaxID=1538146 RepID=A0A395LLY6_9SPHN|nr:alpha/beta hydrolase [Alteriqipengyuania lutimaris]MBB3033173.1 pimeloyl-ACP methyl ester carboxylesterase [Alteriqipengyuania lutimaris]RDS77775.1 alpha/beta hydrolase [Alteriqipengyuania lutimaris]